MTSTAPDAVAAEPAVPGESVLPDHAAGVLAAARAETAAADRAEARRLALAVQWAVIHPAESLADAETYVSRFGDTELPVAGPGAPLVTEFSVAEFGAALGLPIEAGKHYLGQAVELRYRLPRLWARVMAGDLPAWRARRVADETIRHDLTREAAGYVDAHVAPVAHRVRPAQVDRLVEEAIGRFMPEVAEERRRDAADRRHFSVDTGQVSFDGTSLVHGELDLADALDLEDALRGIAAELKDLGSTDSRDVRRSVAAGELARRQLALDLSGGEDAGESERSTEEPTSGQASRTGGQPVRRTVLYLHLSAEAVTRADSIIGRAEQVRQWCGRPDTRLVVQPVIDLDQHVHVEQYEVRGRVADQVALRDVTCVFPWCSRPARRQRSDEHGCDHDHVTPHRESPETCSCQVAPLCRRHHRVRTHGGWRYHAVEPGTYLWRSPHGYQYLRDHAGTLDVSRSGRSRDARDAERDHHGRR